VARKQLTPLIHRFARREELAAVLADRVAGVLAGAIADRGSGFLAVSGGTTPGTFFEALSGRPLDWSKVVVTLVDERLVPPGSERSNARLARERLLVREAAAARFVPLHSAAATPAEAALHASARLARQPWPLDAAVLGMGTDGHTASFFPDAEDLDTLLDPDAAEFVLPVIAPSAGEPRLTLSLPVILAARFLALHIEGEAKRQLLERVVGGRERLPIRALLENAAVEVFWTA
jgi:6-phosphogluconolactonase